jgi:hypothetical protein
MNKYEKAVQTKISAGPTASSIGSRQRDRQSARESAWNKYRYYRTRSNDFATQSNTYAPRRDRRNLALRPPKVTAA